MDTSCIIRYIKGSEKNYMSLVTEVTNKMCKRTLGLTSHGQHIFSMNESVGTVAE